MNLAEYKWIEHLNDEVPSYLQSLQSPNQRVRFQPCLKGITPEGQQISLGFSCFALKTYYTIGLWEKLDHSVQEVWIAFLKSFQVDSKPTSNHVSHNAFIDPPVVEYLANQKKHRQLVIHRLFRRGHLTELQKVIIAETKQAIATLAQVNATPARPYLGFPTSAAQVRKHLKHLNWAEPWGAGGQAAALVVFLKTQSPQVLRSAEVRELLDICTRFFDDLVDTNTGAYFRGTIPEYRQLINGAMKVLTALDWLEVPIHWPEKLIDTCLKSPPISEGCDLVDTIYVLYRCWQLTRYNEAEIRAYCEQALDMIKRHHNPDGGFSYGIGRSQTSYYGVPITKGLAESDIHGTCLLSWAIAMILEITENNITGWRVIKP